MSEISFKQFRFPADVIPYAVWLCYRLTMRPALCLGVLAERGIEAARVVILNLTRPAWLGDFDDIQLA